MLTLCVPTLNRYDLLRQMLFSAKAGTVKPDTIIVLNNGMDDHAVREAVKDLGIPTTAYTPEKPMGLAASWNLFIKNTDEERLIVNDDILFGETSIERLVNTPGDIVTGLLPTNACSCFVIRDSCVKNVGLFDETISPGYAYFEDCDYAFRLAERGEDFIGVECGIVHVGSQTLAKMTPQQREEHNRKYVIAQNNFLQKWGRLPQGFTRQYA